MIDYKGKIKEKVIRKTFALHEKDIMAMKIIKSHKITVSDFIRYALRQFAEQLEGENK